MTMGRLLEPAQSICTGCNNRPTKLCNLEPKSPFRRLTCDASCCRQGQQVVVTLNRFAGQSHNQTGFKIL